MPLTSTPPPPPAIPALRVSFLHQLQGDPLPSMAQYRSWVTPSAHSRSTPRGKVRRPLLADRGGPPEQRRPLPQHRRRPGDPVPTPPTFPDPPLSSIAFGRKREESDSALVAFTATFTGSLQPIAEAEVRDALSVWAEAEGMLWGAFHCKCHRRHRLRVTARGHQGYFPQRPHKFYPHAPVTKGLVSLLGWTPNLLNSHQNEPPFGCPPKGLTEIVHPFFDAGKCHFSS